jgi:hypothetical protein
MSLRTKEADDERWVEEVLSREWRSTQVVSRSRIRDAAALLGLIAQRDGQRIGLATYVWSLAKS